MNDNGSKILIGYIISMIVGIAGCLIFAASKNIFGLILLGLGIVSMIVCYVLTKVNEKKNKNKKTKKVTKTSPPKAEAIKVEQPKTKVKAIKKTDKIVKYAEDGTIKHICQDSTIKLNIWGEEREIAVSSQRILYSEDYTEDEREFVPFNASELSQLNWLIKSDIINSDKVKKLFLGYINQVYQQWDDDWYEGKIDSILPPEVELSNIIINNLDFVEDKVIAFCGECMADPEHGISITFVNKKIDGLSNYMGFESYGSDLMYNGTEKKYLSVQEYGKVIEDMGYADSGKVFNFNAVYWGRLNANADNKKRIVHRADGTGYHPLTLSIRGNELLSFDIFNPTEKDLKAYLKVISHVTFDFKDVIDIKVKDLDCKDEYGDKFVKSVNIVLKETWLHKDECELIVIVQEKQLEELNRFIAAVEEIMKLNSDKK